MGSGNNGASIFYRNVDLMHHATIRRTNANMGIKQEFASSSILWEDIILVGFTPTRLRQQSLPRCTSLLIQVSYLFTAPPGGAPWPVVSVRDGSVASQLPLTATNGIELIPGSAVMFQADEQDITIENFIDPTEFWVFLNNLLQVRLHICYGIMK